MNEATLILTPQARDVALVWSLVELRTTNVLLSTMLGLQRDMNEPEIRRMMDAIQREELSKVFLVLSRYGDLDVEGFRDAISKLV